MFPCEMARYIARLAAEARKYGRFSRSVGIHVPASGQRSPTQGHLGVPAGNFARIAHQLHFNISERSAGTSSQLQAGRPVAAAAQPCAAAVEAAPGGPSSGEVAAGPPEAAARPSAAAEAVRSSSPAAPAAEEAVVGAVQPSVAAEAAPSSLPVAPDAEAVTAAQPGSVVRRAECAD